MNVTIVIRYTSPAGEVMQRGSFSLRGKKPEEVAYEWWKKIKLEVYTKELVSVEVNGEDITDKVKALLN
ncbi:hypothetical protein [Bacillus sp. B15-48]|uniref:hypothetical protein n=1 Tax=Bacillus sp. B15-48 TaxID=1548601 RepID=UPI00193F43D9|nr:hypothetical protein [Bacillus sp. B15-48]MBM4762692.1 hypothetical protein [Bacillus sp. B15-48]